jgi:hypothetical protein
MMTSRDNSGQPWQRLQNFMLTNETLLSALAQAIQIDEAPI